MSVCPRCDGTGKYRRLLAPERDCAVCDGTGVIKPEHPELPKLGWNDCENVYCSLCEWSVPCTTMEQMEHRLREHLKDAHGKRLFYRVQVDDGKHTDIPE